MREIEDFRLDEDQLRDMSSEERRDALENAMRKYEQYISAGNTEAASRWSEYASQLEELISYYDEE